MKLKNSCSVYLKLGKRKIKLPVNPEEIEISAESSNKTYYVFGKGEIVVPRLPQLKEVSFESFIPANTMEPYISGDDIGAKSFVDAVERAMKNGTVCKLIVTRNEPFNTNMRCLIREVATTDKGGEPGDIYYKIELLEYKSYSIETINIVTQTQTTATTETAVTAVAEEQRPVDTPTLRVGATVILNGKYWYDSYGSKPFGNANNVTDTVTRIVTGNPYPIHIGTRGWVQESQIQIVG